MLTEAELAEIEKRLEAATPGPWVYRKDQPNGQGFTEARIDSNTGEWITCPYYCFGWGEGSETDRGPERTPGHEHKNDPCVVSGSGYHGTGDLCIEDADAVLIANAPTDIASLLADLKLYKAALEEAGDLLDEAGWVDVARDAGICPNLATVLKERVKG